jgi:antitoxin component HigA of HigAB toxin-antitoxin module
MIALMQELSEPVMIRPIKTEADYEAALTELDEMIGINDSPVSAGVEYSD